VKKWPSNSETTVFDVDANSTAGRITAGADQRRFGIDEAAGVPGFEIGWVVKSMAL
jgi:hypothetical protein